MKKYYCLVLLLVVLQSCNTNEESFEDCIKSNDYSMSSSLDRFSELESIPLNAEKFMNREEKLLFDSLSYYFRIDYSFINSKYYISNRNEILSDLRGLLLEYQTKNKRAYLIIGNDECLLKSLERQAPSEWVWPEIIYETYKAYDNGGLVLEVKVGYKTNRPYGVLQPLHSVNNSNYSFEGNTSTNVSGNTITCKTIGKLVNIFEDTIDVNSDEYIIRMKQND